MTDSKPLLPPLAPDLAVALQVERDLPPAPLDARDRIRDRITLTLGIGTAAVNSPGTHPPTVPAAPLVAPTPAASLPGATLLKWGAAMAVAVMVGFGVYHTTRAPGLQAPVPSSPSPTPTVIVPAPRVSAQVAEPSSAPMTRPAVPATPRRRAQHLDDLTAERALLDDARAALGSGQAASAYAQTEAHRRRFSAGQLSEERESLAIKALVRLGRPAQAEARAARFRRRYPGSMFQPTIDAALAAPTSKDAQSR